MTGMECDNCGAQSRAYEGRNGRYCSSDCQHAAECRADGTCCSDNANSLPEPMAPGGAR